MELHNRGFFYHPFTHYRVGFPLKDIHSHQTAPLGLLADSLFVTYSFNTLFPKVIQESPLNDVFLRRLLLPARQVCRGEELEHVEQRCVVRDDDEYIWACVERLERIERDAVSDGILYQRRDGFVDRRGAKCPWTQVGPLEERAEGNRRRTWEGHERRRAERAAVVCAVPSEEHESVCGSARERHDVVCRVSGRLEEVERAIVEPIDST